MSTKDLIAIVFCCICAAFSAFLFMDSRHTHPADVVALEAKFNRKIEMKESTRYAEVEKYYTDELKDGASLSDAQMKRLDLVQRQQVRIAETLEDGQ